MKPKSNAAFLKKIQTITIGTGAKATAPKCADCGGGLKLIGAIAVVRRRSAPARDTSAEQSFAM